MKVFIVVEDFYSSAIDGVFSTREKAEAWWKEYHPYWTLAVVEFEVDEQEIVLT